MEWTNADLRRRAELAQWLDFVHQLPPGRVDKVHFVRDALRCGRYDDDRMMDETVDRLSYDLDFGAGWPAPSFSRPR